MKKLRLIYYLLRYMGIGWCLFRVWYALKLKSGWFRWRCPAKAWEEVNVESGERRAGDGSLVVGLGDPEKYLEYRRSKDAPKFFFSPQDREKFQPLFAQWDKEISPVTEADAILAGEFRFYSKTEKEVGFPPNWHKNHFTGEIAPVDRHWSDLGDFGFGDIKNIWELSRFGWAYILVRAYWRTGDEKYPKAFWALFEDWMENNPPNRGVHWKCGQEISFRLMAWCFALYGFLESPATSGERVKLMLKAVAESGDRVAANLSYAVSQKNNHGISEAMGLWTVGILFSELKRAAAWKKRGQRTLESLAGKLIYRDGSFAQHSMIYHRLMVHDYAWADRLGTLAGTPLGGATRERVALAVDFLRACQDGNSGRVPLYGANDGSRILPLDDADYLDFRPVVALGGAVFKRVRFFEGGSWDEAVLWLAGTGFTELPISNPSREMGFVGTEGGYYVLRDRESFVFTRCGPFRHRPGEADLLHVDIWWRGENIAGDPGSFSYNATGVWDGALKRTIYHNCVTVDGRDQMTKIGKFLWLPWVRGRVERFQQAGLREIEGSHDGYEKLAVPVHYRRAVVSLGDDSWAVFDRCISSGPHEYHLHWLLPDGVSTDQERISIRTEAGTMNVKLLGGALAGAPADLSLAIHRAERDSAYGWRSPFYQYVEPATSVRAALTGTAVFFVSVFSPHTCGVSSENGSVEITILDSKRKFTIEHEHERNASVFTENSRESGGAVNG